MKILCKKNTSEGLDLKEVTDVFVNNYRYGLEIGREYVVMGMMTLKDSNCLYYLIDHDNNPKWVPYLLFDVTDNSLPGNWYINVIDKSEPGNIFTLIGFDELCNDDNFHDALMEHNDAAMKTYFRHRMAVKNDVY